ncbi:malonic semialdehyde reductase [Kineococcus sp. NUM-3379]
MTTSLPAPRTEQRPATLDEAGARLLFRDARTANRWLGTPVGDEQLRAVLDLAKWPPTALNSQPLRLLAVRSPEARARLVPHMSGGNAAKTATAPLTLIVAADVDFHEDLPRLAPAVPGARDFFPDEEARQGVAVFNAGLQLGYLVLAIRALGLAAGPMTGIDAPAIEREFLPDGRHRVVAVVNVGVEDPAGTYPRAPRLDFDEVVTTV